MKCPECDARLFILREVRPISLAYECSNGHEFAVIPRDNSGPNEVPSHE